jgi:Nucleoside-diphosphate-sugar epimerases
MSEKRILITGATGFIGSNILRFGLEKKEATFFAVVRKNTKNLWRIKDLIDSHSVNIIELDLTDIASVNEMMKQIKPDVVFHCATYGMFLDKEKDFNSMIEINIKSLISLINSAFENKVKTFINTGSTSEYGINKAYERKYVSGTCEYVWCNKSSRDNNCLSDCKNFKV